MTKSIHSVLLTTIGVLAFLMVANLAVHLMFYIIDGNTYKLFSPIWLWLNGITLLLCFLFTIGWKRRPIA